MISTLILQNLLHSNEYWRRVIPFLKAEYFEHPGERAVFETIESFVADYGQPPTLDALAIEVNGRIGEDQALADWTEKAYASVTQLSGEDQNQEWLLDSTEKFCRDQALHNALRKSIMVLDGKDTTLTQGGLPKLLQAALDISFDTQIGHDYLEDWEARWDERNRVESRVEFDLEYLNRITRGGLLPKTLTAFMAPSGVGKSIMLCHLAAGWLAAGKNVMYVSCEMSEFNLAERIDMNLLNMTSDELGALSKEDFKNKIHRFMKKPGIGKLLFKEYGPGSASAGTVRALLNDAKRKKGFRPDVIIVDYLNILCSMSVKLGGSVNSYTLVKKVAEELRELAVEFNVPIVTATQVNRDGYDNSDIGMTETSESMGLVHTLDLFLAMIMTDELADLKQILIKQLKNRYRDERIDGKFVLGLDKSRMKFFDAEARAQRGLSGSDSPPPQSPRQQAMRQRNTSDFT